MAVIVPSSLRQICRSIRAAAALATLLALLSILPDLALAQEAAAPERTRITGAALQEALRQAGRGNPLSDVIIAGKELQDIIQAGEQDIRIDNALIEGGLAFEGESSITPALSITNSEITAQAISRRLSAGASLYARSTTFQALVDFSGTTFLGPVDFGQASFSESARFHGARFTEPARFDRATFEGSAGFQKLVAESHLGFGNTTFKDRAAFGKATFAEVSFDKAEFYKTANFGNAVLGDTGSFTGTRFDGRTRFDGATFTRAQIFEAQFDGLATFVGTRFQDNVEFRPGDAQASRQFKAGATFFDTQVDGYAVFNHLDVSGDLSILSSRFAGGLQAAFSNFGATFNLTDSQMQGPTNFDGSVFRDAASFARSRFEAETIARASRFLKSAVFQEACFTDALALANSDLGPYADFRGASVGHLDLRSTREPTIFGSRFDLRGADIARATFEDVIFTNHVDLSDATFGRHSIRCGDTEGPAQEAPGLDLRFVTFEDAVSAQRTSFNGRLAMFGAKFEQGVDFTNATFPELGHGEGASFSLAFVDFGDLRLRWRQLPDPRFWTQASEAGTAGSAEDAGQPDKAEPISRTLAGLERMFRSRNQLADTNSATYHRKRAELREARQAGWTSDRLEKELEWLVWGLTCGYGTKIWWIVGWALLLNLLFTLIYWRWAILERAPHPDVEKDFSFRLRLLDLPQHYRKAVGDLADATASQRKLINALRVSSVILFKVGYRDTTLSGRIGRIDVKSIVRLEWFLGFLVLAAFTVTLSNTQPLINRLISGVL